MNEHRQMQNPPAGPDNTVSIIGSETSVVGHCKTAGIVQIEGSVEGSVESGNTITVGKGGVIVGDIIARDAVIAGRIHGKLMATSLVELQASCHVDGEIDTDRIVIEEGAMVNATIKTASRSSQPSSSAP